ncbi:hypothetical protein LA080_012295 [Diaporthe eres]|nr:hypothetical protein LA080_012295 [Diaporthe eres]
MPEGFLTRLGQALFTVQSVIAFAVFLFASQREAFPWAGWVTSAKLPWSFLIPLKFFFLFAGAPPSNLYQAGLLTPLSVTIGLICVIIYDEAIPVVPRGRILGEIQSGGDSHV